MIAHVDNRITYNGNGNATEFAYQFKILDRADIKVLLTDADGKEKLLTEDYYVDVEKNVVRYPGYAVGAEVPESERPPVLPTGWKLTIYREVPVTQETDLPDQYPFNQVEDIVDKLTMIVQQLTDVTGRSLKIGVSTSADIDTTIPWENGKSFRISDDGKTLELSEDPAKVLPLAQGVYAQTQAQAQSAAASATAAAKSEDSAFESAGVAGNSAQYASLSAASAAENAELTSGYKQEALTAKADATASATNAKASEANAKISENNAEASKEAAQSAATTASNFANASRSSANEARTYKDNAKTYMDNAKNYSENVNVFTPSVSADGVLSWTNKAELENPTSVNIKGEKGDKGDTGAAGSAAAIRIGTVTTGAPGSEAIVTNVGTANDAVFNFTIPRGEKGEGGGSGGGTSVTVDTKLSATSTNPVQNKIIKNEFDSLLLPDGMLTIPSSQESYISKIASDSIGLINNRTQTVIEQSADGNTWETLFDSDTANETVKTLYKNGSNLSPYIDVAKGKMVRVTLSTHSTLYFASIALGMKIMNESTPAAQSTYKCYAGMNSLNSSPVARGDIATWGSTPCTTFRRLSFNTVRYIFNEDKKDLTIYFSGIYCKGSTPNRSVLRYDSGNRRTVTDFPIEAPSFLGTATKAKADAEGNIITDTYAKSSAANTWEAPQTFKKAICKEVTIAKEIYGVSYTDGGAITLATNVVHYVANSEVTLDMAQAITDFLSVDATSTVFSIYITTLDDSAAYPLIITNAGTLKYVGSASDFAITGAGLLLNILMMKDESDAVTSIVQASKLEGGA